MTAAPAPLTREALLEAAKPWVSFIAGDGCRSVASRSADEIVDTVLNLLDAHLALKLDDRNSGWNDAIRVVRADIATWRTP